MHKFKWKFCVIGINKLAANKFCKTLLTKAGFYGRMVLRGMRCLDVYSCFKRIFTVRLKDLQNANGCGRVRFGKMYR